MSRPSTAEQEWPVPGRDGWTVRLHRPGAGKRSWRVTFPDGAGGTTENTRLDRDDAVQLAHARVAELTLTLGGPSRGHRPIQSLVDYYLTDFAAHKRWVAGYRQERAKAIRWLPPWFLALPVSSWRTRHCDEVLAGVTAAGHPEGSGEYWRCGTVLSGLVTAGERGDFLAVTSDRPSPMRNVSYAKHRPEDRTQARGSLGDAPERYQHVQPIRADQIPGQDDVEAYAETGSSP